MVKKRIVKSKKKSQKKVQQRRSRKKTSRRVSKRRSRKRVSKKKSKRRSLKVRRSRTKSQKKLIVRRKNSRRRKRNSKKQRGGAGDIALGARTAAHSTIDKFIKYAKNYGSIVAYYTGYYAITSLQTKLGLPRDFHKYLSIFALGMSFQRSGLLNKFKKKTGQNLSKGVEQIKQFSDSVLEKIYNKCAAVAGFNKVIKARVLAAVSAASGDERDSGLYLKFKPTHEGLEVVNVTTTATYVINPERFIMAGDRRLPKKAIGKHTHYRFEEEEAATGRADRDRDRDGDDDLRLRDDDDAAAAAADIEEVDIGDIEVDVSMMGVGDIEVDVNMMEVGAAHGIVASIEKENDIIVTEKDLKAVAADVDLISLMSDVQIKAYKEVKAAATSGADAYVDEEGALARLKESGKLHPDFDSSTFSQKDF